MKRDHAMTSIENVFLILAGRVSHFFLLRRLGPSICRSQKKKNQEFQAPPKKFEILATPKNIHHSVH